VNGCCCYGCCCCCCFFVVVVVVVVVVMMMMMMDFLKKTADSRIRSSAYGRSRVTVHLYPFFLFNNS